MKRLASEAQTKHKVAKSGCFQGWMKLMNIKKAEKQAYKTSALTDLSSIEGELAELNARIPALENRVERTSVRSPVDGVINRINYVTADAYVKNRRRTTRNCTDRLRFDC